MRSTQFQCVPACEGEEAQLQCFLSLIVLNNSSAYRCIHSLGNLCTSSISCEVSGMNEWNGLRPEQPPRCRIRNANSISPHSYFRTRRNISILHSRLELIH